MKEIKVLSWNIRHGLKEDGEINIYEFVEKTIELQPDIILIQEMDRWCVRSNKVDQFYSFKNALGADWDGVWGTRLYMGGTGLYGIATFSRLPIYESANHILADEHKERTIAQESILKIDKDLVSVVNIHMPFDRYHGTYHTEISWSNLFEMSFQDNLILGGDFNATPKSSEIEMIMNECTDLGELPTSTAGRIDYIVSRGNYQPIKHEVVDFWLSDHYPIFTTFAKTI